ncbi:MAG TPA: amidohydrolase family protein [Planctomycetota bacterium]|nr:amidohydrolase family protein [Planctomycetota bacterium]
MQGTALCLAVAFLGTALVGCALGATLIAGPSRPSDVVAADLSPESRALIDRAFDGIDPSKQIDVHVHIAGVGAGRTGCCVNPQMQSGFHPVKRLQFQVYLRAAGIRHPDQADGEYIERLVERMRTGPNLGRCQILAFDRRYRRDGSVDEARTEFYVPNEYVLELAKKYPDVFRPTISVHPYRSDALVELERGAEEGATMVKWLPNSMGIDPSDPLCDRFYDKMRDLGLILLSHGGEEKAVDAAEDQRLGNPLLLRRALDRGVRVIVAHCAGLGENMDLDDLRRGTVPNFDLFLRLMGEEKYRGLVFGEISAVLQFNRFGVSLETLLRRSDLHDRLVNGSDYPLPAINALVRTGSLVSAGFLSPEERKALNEIYEWNPLVFDFVLKRTVHLPGSGRRFPASIFMQNPALVRRGS